MKPPICTHCGQPPPATPEATAAYQRVWQRAKWSAIKAGKTPAEARRIARKEANAAKAAVMRGEVRA